MDEIGEDRIVRRIEIVELDEEATLVVALAEGSDGGGRALIIQGAVAFDEQEAALGMDTYCLSDESGASVYGGIHNCAIVGDVLTLQLGVEAAATLAINPLCRFHLHADTILLTQLCEGLRRIFADDPAATTAFSL